MKSTRNSAVTFAGAGALAILLASSAFADSGSRYGGQRNDGQPQGKRQQAAGTWQGGNQTNDRNGRNGQYNDNRNDNRNGQYNNDNRNSNRSGQYNNDNRNSNRNGQYNNDNRNNNRGGQYNNGRDNNNGRYNDNNGGNRSYRDNERVQLSGNVSSFSRERDGYRVRLDREDRSFWVPAARLRNGGRDLRVGLSIGLGGIFRGGTVEVDAVNVSDVYARGGGYQQGLVTGIVDRIDYRTGTLLVRDVSTGRLIDVSMDSTTGRGLDARDLRRGDTVTLSGDWLRGNSFAAYRIDTVNSGR